MRGIRRDVERIKKVQDVTFLIGNSFAFAPHAYHDVLVLMPLKTAASACCNFKVSEMELARFSFISD